MAAFKYVKSSEVQLPGLVLWAASTAEAGPNATAAVAGLVAVVTAILAHHIPPQVGAEGHSPCCPLLLMLLEN